MIAALEFYSGIGAFAQAVRGTSITVAGAFDQGDEANKAYSYNHDLIPCSANLDSIKLEKVPRADLWWLSPPCTPFTIRGEQKGLFDARAKSFLNLLDILEERRPTFVFLENVIGFENSDGCRLLYACFARAGYHCRQIKLCPTQFGVPMKRPRYFIVASLQSLPDKLPPPTGHTARQLSEYIVDDHDEELFLEPDAVERYEDCMNIVPQSALDQTLICFTRGYYKCYKASGSFLKLENGRVRRFAPLEIQRLMGFSTEFSFPAQQSLRTRLSLLGNTVHVDSIRHLLGTIGIGNS